MIRQWLRMALPLVIGFTLYILLVHAQPNEAATVRTLLTPPDDCPAPCFLGIRPGVTTVAKALTILDSHPWVESVNSVPNLSNAEEGLLILTWNGRQSPYIDSASSSALHTCGDLICGLSIPTKLELGIILLNFGAPDSATLRSIPDAPHAVIFYAANYDSMQLTIRATSFCPPIFTAMGLHHRPVTLQLGDVGEQISISKLYAARFQMIHFQKQSYPWLLRRAFVCDL